jgi:hypothetical protein
VTADELEPYKTADGLLDLTMRAWIGGDLLGEDSLANCAFTFEELISFASRGSAVAPGDLLASGTCHRGCLTEIWGRSGERVPPPLVPGDVVTLEVGGIGTVRNRIVDPAPYPPVPPRPAARPPALTSTALIGGAGDPGVAGRDRPGHRRRRATAPPCSQSVRCPWQHDKRPC